MDFTKKIDTGKSISAANSPFRKGKLPTKTIRIRVPYYDKIRKYAFIQESAKSDVIDEILKYGMRYYERKHKLGKYHK